MRGLVHLRQILMNVGMQVVTEQFALGAAHEAFAEDSSLKGDRHRSSVVRMARAIAVMGGGGGESDSGLAAVLSLAVVPPAAA